MRRALALLAVLLGACSSSEPAAPAASKPEAVKAKEFSSAAKALRAVLDAKDPAEREKLLLALDALEVPKDPAERTALLREALRPATAAAESRPAVLSLNAYSTSAETNLGVFRGERPTIPWGDGHVLAPALPVTGSNSASFSEARALVLEHIARANRELGFDPDRLVIAGHSMGGELGYDFIARHPDRFAGLACIAGGMPQIQTPLPNLRTVKVYVMHGAKDESIELRVPRENVDVLKSIGTEHVLDILPEGTHAWPTKREDAERLARWLSTQRRDPWPRELDLIFPAYPESNDPKRRIYWLELPPQNKNRRATARVSDNTITLGHCLEFKKVTLYLGEPLVDLDRPVSLRYEDGRLLFKGKLERRFRTLVEDLATDGWDTSRAAPARLEVALPF